MRIERKQMTGNRCKKQSAPKTTSKFNWIITRKKKGSHVDDSGDGEGGAGDEGGKRRRGLN